MNNKKGFTLIELLAVIVILAIIALIATPIVLNMINNARKKAAESSALGFVDAIEYNNGFAQTEQAGYTEINGENLDATSINVKMKGKKPTGGTVTIENGKVTNANICVEGYTVVYDGREVTKVDKGCSESSEQEEVTWDNYITPTQKSGGSTLPDGSTNWIQENTKTGDKEICSVFSGGTVCLHALERTDGKVNDIIFDEENQNCSLTGYVLQKKTEMEKVGASCTIFKDTEVGLPPGTCYISCNDADAGVNVNMNRNGGIGNSGGGYFCSLAPDGTADC